MAIDFPFALEVHFLTVEQSARYLDVTADIVVSLIEQGRLFAFAAIPPTPMVPIPIGHKVDMFAITSNLHHFQDVDLGLEKATITQSGIFRVTDNVIKSVAIRGNSLVRCVWTLSLSDYGYDDEGDQNQFGRQLLLLRHPVEIGLSDIRLPTHLLKSHKELNDSLKKLEKIAAEKKIVDESKPIPDKSLHETERRTLLNIIKALAQLKGIKPIKERENGDGWWKAANELLQELARKQIEAPCNEKTLAKHLKNSFESLR